jgi:malonyl-CoA O-methyltransferase
MSIQKAYDEWSQTYDADDNATRDLDRQLLERVLGDRRFAAIIEAGCGTGKNTEFLADKADSVIAFDFSAGMMEKARAKVAHLPNVTFAATDITKPWPTVEGFADLVTCDLILEHIEQLSPVFAEAARALVPGGLFFVCELHPFRQYAGTVANFSRGEQKTSISAFVHHISDFLEAAKESELALKSLQEWWHEKDTGKPPRLVSFLFEKRPNCSV